MIDKYHSIPSREGTTSYRITVCTYYALVVGQKLSDMILILT